MPIPFSPKLRLAPLWPAIAALIAATATAIALLPEPIREEAAHDLDRSLLLVTPALPAPVRGLSAPDAELQQRLVELAAGTGFRITIVSLSGVVLADTEVDLEALSALENHRNRPEIATALALGSGRHQRLSRTTGEETVYAARLIVGADGTTWVARLARPIRSLAVLRGRLVRIELAAALLAAIVAWLVSLWLAKSLFRPLTRLIDAAERLAAGSRRQEIEIPETPELATLGRALDRLAAHAERQMTAVADERDHLRATVASMHEGVLMIDERGTPEVVNPAFRALFGVAPEAATESILDLAREPQLVDLLGGVRRSGQPAALTIERLEPTPHSIALLASPLAGSGGAVVVARDLSESERLHQMRRDFVANVSHELRTPLAAIRGFAETLVDGAIEDRATALRFSQRILAQCGRLAELLDDLLTLSRLESAEALRELGPVELQALVDEAVHLVQPGADAKQITIDSTSIEPLAVTGEAEGLLRLLINLLDNAVKYSHRGGRVEIRLARTDDEVVIEVTDDGVGIDAAHLPRLFERFYRVDPGRSREEGGTGLGLAIVKHVAQAHGGRVDVESMPGRGSTFRVTLPVGV